MKIKPELKPGKVALVTGGSSGIGKAIACGLAERGMNVWLMAQRKDILDSALSEVETHRKDQNQQINTISADITDVAQVQKAILDITDRSGTPDLIINSAGVAHPGYIQDLDFKIFTWMMEVNYFGTVHVTKEILPGMLKKGSGYIVNVSSIAGFIGTFGYTAYGASKFAVRGFSDALRAEMKLHNIGVSVVFPPDTQTPQLEYENNYKPAETKALSGNSKVMTPQKVSEEIIDGISRGKYLILPGFDGKLFYRLNNVLGMGLAYIMDQIIARENKRSKSIKTKEA
jgi:3-dehydrosphinganine reductase